MAQGNLRLDFGDTFRQAVDGDGYPVVHVINVAFVEDPAEVSVVAGGPDAESLVRGLAAALEDLADEMRRRHQRG